MKYQNGKTAIFCQIAILHFCPYAPISKILLAKCLLFGPYENGFGNFSSESVSGPLQPSRCAYPGTKWAFLKKRIGEKNF